MPRTRMLVARCVPMAKHRSMHIAGRSVDQPPGASTRRPAVERHRRRFTASTTEPLLWPRRAILPRMPDAAALDDARALLQRAMALHTAGQIEEAVSAAEEAAALAPNYAEAHAYLGNTLVTRQRRFADGLGALERARAAAPDDATIAYTYGWCLEYVANALARPKGAHQPVDASADELYASARAVMLEALELDPDDQLRGDMEDILDVIAAATGEPWSDEEVTRAAPRAR